MKTDETLKASQLVSQSTIYNNSSVEKLAKFLVGIIADPDSFVLNSNRADGIDLMISKFTTGLSEPIQSDAAGAIKKPVDAAVVLLTGSTGNLGAQILEALLRDSRVSQVYTLNRASSGSKSLKERHVERFVEKGLDVALLESPRLVLLEGDASQKKLGLVSDVYDQVSIRTSCGSAYVSN